MTDERYAFVEDVKNSKNLARSGGKKGKSRYGCSLPVDYMTTKEKRDANSRWISVTYYRPISFDKFLAYSDDDKKKYLQTLIDRYAGDIGKIAKMFGCEDALNSGGDTKLRIFVQKPKGVTNTSFQIPPDYLQDFFAVMRRQLKILKNEKKREEESDEKEKARA